MDKNVRKSTTYIDANDDRHAASNLYYHYRIFKLPFEAPVSNSAYSGLSDDMFFLKIYKYMCLLYFYRITKPFPIIRVLKSPLMLLEFTYFYIRSSSFTGIYSPIEDSPNRENNSQF